MHMVMHIWETRAFSNSFIKLILKQKEPMPPFSLGGVLVYIIFTPLLALCIALNFNRLLLPA